MLSLCYLYIYYGCDPVVCLLCMMSSLYILRLRSGCMLYIMLSSHILRLWCGYVLFIMLSLHILWLWSGCMLYIVLSFTDITVAVWLYAIHYVIFYRYYGCGLVVPEHLEGTHILDLGSGAGYDCYVLSKLVGEDGHVTGVDMTDEQVGLPDDDFLFLTWLAKIKKSGISSLYLA